MCAFLAKKPVEGFDASPLVSDNEKTCKDSWLNRSQSICRFLCVCFHNPKQFHNLSSTERQQAN